MAKLGTLWRTVRHLKARQLTGRLAFRLARPAPELRPAPPVARRTGRWVGPARRERSLVDHERFRFLNEEHDLAAIGWDDGRIEKLWRYNLHYFDDLNAAGAGSRSSVHRHLMARWIAENPPGRGTGWEPYPVSLRIVNWIKWALSGGPTDAAWLDSLAVQIRWLTKRLEWHLLGNHLFANAKALLVAGLFFDGEEADEWRRSAVAILVPQLAEQILRDGGQFERSPMYHALAFEDVLDLINAQACLGASHDGTDRLIAELRRVAPAMLVWLRAMALPDGTLTHFNDSADGIAPSLAELERYAHDLGIIVEMPEAARVIHLHDTGYVRLNRGRASAWLDVAPIGPDYLPGHAHADTLSFELAVDGAPVIVNGGTSCYGMSPRRLRERGTAWHNTVQIGPHDSSEVWAGFRVGRRAYPIDVEVGVERVAAGHDGYRFLPGRPIHRRIWTLGEGHLRVDDVIEPARGDGCARFHMAPGLAPVRLHDDLWEIRRGDAPVASVRIEHAAADWIPSEHSPQFGMLVPSMSLRCAMPQGRCTTIWTWKP